MKTIVQLKRHHADEIATRKRTPADPKFDPLIRNNHTVLITTNDRL